MFPFRDEGANDVFFLSFRNKLFFFLECSPHNYETTRLISIESQPKKIAVVVVVVIVVVDAAAISFGHRNLTLKLASFSP